MGETQHSPRNLLAAPGQILDPRLQPGDRLQLHRLLRTAQRDQVKPDAPTLELKQLVQDERLRQPGEPVDDDDEVRPASLPLRPTPPREFRDAQH